MIITIEKIKQKIEAGKLDLPNIHKHNICMIEDIKTRDGVYCGVKVGGDNRDNYYVVLQVVNDGNSCNVCHIAVDRTNGDLTYGLRIIGTINKRYVYKEKYRIKEHFKNE